MKGSTRLISLSSAVAVLAVAATTLRAQDWPQWRGPNRDDKVAGFTPPKTWPEQLKKKWTVPVGQGDATPALVGGKLYVFTRQGDNEILECLDADKGTLVWSNQYEALPATGPAGRHPGPRSSATVAEGKVVTLGVRGTLSCLDAQSGKLLWRKDEIKGWPNFFTGMSPLVTQGLCIAHLGSKSSGALVAYDLSSGAEKWKWTGDGPAYASPVLMSVGEDKLIVTQTDHQVVALKLADGSLAWETSYAGKGMGAGNYDTPIVNGQTILYTGTSRGTVAVRLSKQGDAFSATGLWTNLDNSPRFCTPVLKDGFLYGLSEQGNFYCINALTGQTAWTETAGGHDNFGSVLDAGPVLVALTSKSRLIVFEPGGKEYSQVASIPVSDKPIYAHPVLVGNRLFVKDADSLTLFTLE